MTVAKGNDFSTIYALRKHFQVIISLSIVRSRTSTKDCVENHFSMVFNCVTFGKVLPLVDVLSDTRFATFSLSTELGKPHTATYLAAFCSRHELCPHGDVFNLVLFYLYHVDVVLVLTLP